MRARLGRIFWAVSGFLIGLLVADLLVIVAGNYGKLCPWH